MLDRDLGEALLKLDLSPPAEAPAAQVERVIDADRQHVRRWARISIALWILAALGGLAVFVVGGLAFPVIARMLVEKGEGTLENPNTPFLALSKLVAMCMVLGTATAVTLVCAGLATVVLLSRSRSATLRQINANLLMISKQLKSNTSKTPDGQPRTDTGDT
jgi:hypothetical protein